MFYLSGNKRDNLIGVIDSDDNVEEFYTIEYLNNLGLPIIRFNKELPLKKIYATQYFTYELVEIDGIRGWKLYANMRNRVFKSESTLLGYPVISMECCFEGYKRSSIDVADVDTSNVIDMQQTFSNCGLLKKLDLSSWDTSKVKCMRFMFTCCFSLKELYLHNFTSESVQNMSALFLNTRLKILDIPNFIVPTVRDLFSIFTGCDNGAIVRIPYTKLGLGITHECILIEKYTEGVEYDLRMKVNKGFRLEDIIPKLLLTLGSKQPPLLVGYEEV